MRLAPPKLQILDRPTMARIDAEARGLLRTVGVRVHSADMRRRLRAAGGRVDEGNGLVRLPDELVNAALAACPREFTLCDLDGHGTVYKAGSAAAAVGTYVEAVKFLDYGGTALRPSRLADLQRGLIVGDSLAIVQNTGIVVWPTELSPAEALRVSLHAILTSTRKPLAIGLQNLDQTRLLLDALAAAAPTLDLARQPPVLFACSPTSPLLLDADSAAVLIHATELGLVPCLASCPMAGATSPYAIAGTVLQQVAELLFMVVAKFAVRPEAPCLWDGSAAPMDMRIGDVAYGAPERSLMMLANIDMGGYYGLPVHAPACSVDSVCIDAQMGAEKMWTYLTRALSLAASGLAVGGVTNGKAVSLEQMVIDDDLLRAVFRLADGIEFDHLPAAARDIADTGPGGNFMTAPSTLDLLHDGREYADLKTFNRAGSGAPAILERAHERVERILRDWRRPVPPDAVSAVSRVLHCPEPE